MDAFNKRPIGQCPHGLKIYLVDGTYVRNTYDSDFVQGGNPERYKWVPKGEIWVDESTPKQEVPFVSLHECDEANLMSTKGEDYDQAHDEAKELENKYRHANDSGQAVQPNRCVIMTCYNGQGQLLMGKRNDNQLYTLPAGHIEEGESPNQAAARELHEETGMRPQTLSYLKDYTLTDGTELYCFSAYVTGEPHPKNDPDDEVGEWEWIDVDEGLPPKVYNHLHGPQDEQNLIKQLFTLQKSEWQELIKRVKVWHSDDWGNKRISIPSIEHPDRPTYDKNYRAALDAHYGAGLKPIKVTTENCHPKNEVYDTSRYNLYRKMYRAGDRLPPMVVKRNPAGHYDILDGNHKFHAVKAEGGGKMDAVEVPDTLAKTEAKCAECDKPATVKAIWAEGKAYQPSCDDHRAFFERKFGDEFCNFRPINKAEDEVARLLDHPDPLERRMALRLDSVRPEHLFQASLDPDPTIYQPAIDDPRFGPSQSLSLMESVVGKNGAYPDAQKAYFLTHHGMVEPYHFSSLLRAAKMSGPARYAAAVTQTAAHPHAPSGLLRTLYLDPDVAHDARMAILAHLHAPSDVLDHAVKTALTVPGGGSAALGSRAVEHLELPYGSLRALVERAADRSEPHVVEMASHALEYNQGLSGPALAEIFKDLLPKARLKPLSAAPTLLAALLRNKSVPPQLADEATHVLPPEALLKAGVMDNPSFGAKQLQAMLSKAESLLTTPAQKPEMDSFARHPVIQYQLGFEPANHKAFRAAQFLAMDAIIPPERMRAALYEEDGDVDRAALVAYNLPPTDENLAALRAIASLKKSDDPIMEPTPHADKIVTAHPEGEDVADMIRRAFKTNYVFPVALGGKHSKGSFLAYDEKTKTTVLLKSGSGGAGGAAGSSQEMANPNAREAAFWYVAKSWKIEDHFPRAEEVILDDHVYAALQLLSLDFKTLDEREKKDPGTARRVLAPFLHDGTMHKWATLDYVCGNPDRHGQNVMVDDKGEVRLIDHGSAFAGTEFDPAHDHGSFVPYYLRAWCLDENFNKLPTETKLKDLPRVPATVAQELKKWVASIVPEDVKLLCTRYGINPEPTLNRLMRVQVGVATQPLDLVVNQLWVST